MANNSSSLALKLIAVLALLVAAGAAVVYFARPVARVAAVTSGPAASAVPGSVNVIATRETQIKCEIGGRILRSELEEGQAFKEGDFMLQIDTRDLQLEIERIQSEFEALKERLEVGSQIALELANARDDLTKQERYFKLGNLAEAELTRQQRAVNGIEQRLALEKVENKKQTAAYENTLAVKKLQLEKMTVNAPFDGVVRKVLAHKNDLIGNNSSIAEYISTSRYVEAKISEENFAGVRVGQDALVRFLSYGDQKKCEATVGKIMPTADPETQRYVVHLEVKIAPELLVPGMTGEVSIVVGKRQAQALVPRRALRGTQLLVVTGGRVEARTVAVGYVSLTDVEILSGVKPGESVIVEELETYRDGQRVRTEPAKS